MIPVNCFIFCFICFIVLFSPFYFRAAVNACFYARLSCLPCQILAAYLMISDKLNDDDDEEVAPSSYFVINFWQLSAHKSCALWNITL